MKVAIIYNTKFDCTINVYEKHLKVFPKEVRLLPTETGQLAVLRQQGVFLYFTIYISNNTHGFENSE